MKTTAQRLYSRAD